MTDSMSLIGTWRMTSWTRKAIATGEVTDAMGADPIGYIAYHADGRMMAFVARRERPRPENKQLKESQKVELFDTMLAYCASYTLEGDKVIHHVDAAWNPAWQMDLIRPYALDGDRLVIAGAPGRDTITSEPVEFRMEFRKV